MKLVVGLFRDGQEKLISCSRRLGSRLVCLTATEQQRERVVNLFVTTLSLEKKGGFLSV